MTDESPTDSPPPPPTLSTRATLFSPVVTWRVEGDDLVRERKPGAPLDRLPIRDLQEVRLWRTFGVTSNGTSWGANLEARLRIAGRWWKMSAHHAEGPFQPANHNEDLLAVLHLAVKHRRVMGDGLICRSGSGWQMIGAISLLVLVVATVGVFVVGITLRGIPPSPPWSKLLGLVVILVIMLAAALFLARSGRRRTMSVADFLEYNGERAFHFGGR